MSKSNITLTPDFIQQVADLYSDMGTFYDSVASKLDFSCSGCTDNCCDSFFLHHTYTEWAYLWHGLNMLDENDLQAIIEKSSEYVKKSEAAIAKGERPAIMCPLNSKGLCVLYKHRLMICRLHGVPATFTRPDGKQHDFPGCFRCQEITQTKESSVSLDRTSFFQRLVELELKLLGSRKNTVPRIKLTIAQMITSGPPSI